jgi:hypothetical protein
LAPPMTPELEAKINKKTTNWINDQKTWWSSKVTWKCILLQTGLLVMEGVHRRSWRRRIQTISQRPLWSRLLKENAHYI